MNKPGQRGEDPGRNEDEVCFSDVLGVNESAVWAMGNDELRQ